ncbi:MAG: hypothetical protein RH945_09420 [Hyphomonas sp.]
MGIAAEVTKENLVSIILKARDGSIRCVLVDLQNRSQINNGNRETSFEATYPDLAERFYLEYFPSPITGVEITLELRQTDRLHPTAAGVKIIAEGRANFLEPVITSIE